jgi:hypothetical protein
MCCPDFADIYGLLRKYAMGDGEPADVEEDCIHHVLDNGWVLYFAECQLKSDQAPRGRFIAISRQGLVIRQCLFRQNEGLWIDIAASAYVALPHQPEA